MTSGYPSVFGSTGGRKEAQKFIAQNRGATFHDVVSERYEAGIVRGSEVKSLRDACVGNSSEAVG